MSNPLQNDPPRRSSEEKIAALADLLSIIVRALLSIFGKRQSDR